MTVKKHDVLFLGVIYLRRVCEGFGSYMSVKGSRSVESKRGKDSFICPVGGRSFTRLVEWVWRCVF